VREYNVPVECGAVIVSPGDLIFADFDGVVAISAAAIESAISLATEKASRESHSREELRQGAYLRDVYKKYGVL
ncbi:MAG: RraA family protein, partial [Vicinamibacteraceae bacterium]